MAMQRLGLYSVSDPSDKVLRGYGQAAQSYASMDKVRTTEEPRKTVGGGLAAASGMALAGAEAGSMVLPGPGTAIGAVIGTAVGGLSYYLS